LLIILSRLVSAENSDSIVTIAARLAEKGERVAALHIQDACMAATMREYCDRLLKSKIDVLALKAEVEARELVEKVSPNVKMIDYAQWVSLLMNVHDRIVSWTS